MKITGPPPVSPAAPSHHHDGQPPLTANDGHRRITGLDHELPPGLLELLLRTTEVRQDRLDHARAWLAHRCDTDEDEPTCDELASCILDDALSTR